MSSGGCDIVGLARPACLNPKLPENILFNKEVKDDDARLYVKNIPTPWILKQIAPGVGAGAESVSSVCAADCFEGIAMLTLTVIRLGILKESRIWLNCEMISSSVDRG